MKEFKPNSPEEDAYLDKKIAESEELRNIPGVKEMLKSIAHRIHNANKEVEQHYIGEKSICPNPECRQVLGGVTGRKGAVPQGGDVSVCFSCNTALVFNEDLTLRELTTKEYDDLNDHTRQSLDQTQYQIAKRLIAELEH